MFPQIFIFQKKRSYELVGPLGARERDGKTWGEVSNLTVQMVDDFDRRIIKRTTVSITGDEPPRPRLDLDGF